MSTNFPTSLDTFPPAATLAAHTLATDKHSDLHGNLGDAVHAVETAIGVTGAFNFVLASSFVAAGHVLTLAGDATVSGTNSGDQTNISGNAATVTTNANLTGEVTSVGNAATVTRSTAFTWTAAHTFSVAGAASTPAVTLTGTPFAGTGTTSFPELYLNQSTATASTTLNTAGTWFGINSHGTQDFCNFMVDGISKVKVTSANIVVAAGGTIQCGADGNGDTTIHQTNIGTPSINHNSGRGTFITLQDSASIIFQAQSNYSTAPIANKAAANRVAPLQTFQTSAAGSLGNVSGGCIGDVFADTSTTHTDGTEDQLGTITTVANAMIVNGDSIRAKYVVKMVGSATATRRVQIYFAGIVIFDSTALTIGATAGVVVYDVLITRATSTTCRAVVEQRAYGSATLLGFDAATYTPEGTLTGLTLSGSNILKVTGIAAGTGAANGDITLVLGKIHVDGFGS